jgi:hypothetical protein
MNVPPNFVLATSAELRTLTVPTPAVGPVPGILGGFGYDSALPQFGPIGLNDGYSIVYDSPSKPPKSLFLGLPIGLLLSIFTPIALAVMIITVIIVVSNSVVIVIGANFGDNSNDQNEGADIVSKIHKYQDGNTD